MLKSLFALFTVACADADLHLLQMSAARSMQNPNEFDDDLENDEPEVDGPELSDDELVNGQDGSPDDPPSVDDPVPPMEGGDIVPPVDEPALLQDQMVLEDHIALVELDSEDDDAEADDAVGGPDANGVYNDERPRLKRGDIRGYLPRIQSMSECQCEGNKRKGPLGLSTVIYNSGYKRCIFLKSSVDFNNRMAHRGWSSTQNLVCKKTMKWWPVPKTCDGLRGFEHAKCAKLRGEAGYTWGTWRMKKKCYQTVSTNPKMYDWEQAKTYCLKGNSYCNGIAKLTVRKNGGYANEYTFCKEYSGGRFVVGNLPATWPYGGVQEVRRQTRVELASDEFDKYR